MRIVTLLLLLAGCPGPDGPGPDTDTTDSDVEGGCDADADGFDAESCGGADCDDTDDARFPGAPERCNGLDDDCDGEARFEEGVDCTTCEEAGYFAPLVAASDPAATLRDDADPTRCDYGEASRRMFVDLDNDDGTVTGVYTGRQVRVGNDKPDPTVMNTEHTWPQSQGADREPARCDLHHLFPTDSDANQARGNLPLGEVSGSVVWSDGGSRSDGAVFEPRDAHKGDAARALLYFAWRYEQPMPRTQRETMLDWHADDPPDAGDMERERTVARWQRTGNPFVACPFAAEALSAR